MYIKCPNNPVNYPHFTDEQTETEGGHLAKVTQLICGLGQIKKKKHVIKGQGPEELQLKVKCCH